MATRTRRAALLGSALAASAVMSIGGCSSSDPHRATGSQAVTIHTTDELRFSPAAVHAHVGTIVVTLVDDGSYPHNLAVPALHAMSHDVAGTPGEQRTTVTITVPTPGTYGFMCTYHASAGMTGTLIVTK